MTLRAFRGELLSVATDPRDDAGAVRHEPDGLLVVENGVVIARGDYASLADRFADIAVERLPGLVVPGFVDAHVHYPQMDRIASHGEQLLDWLDRHIFPAEKAFADPVHAARVAEAFLAELLRHGTTSALVFATVHAHSVDALFDAALARRMRIVSGKVLMDLGPDGLRDTPEAARGESEALIRRWRGRGRLGYAVTPRFALTSSDAQLAVAGALLAEHPDALLHTHLAENRDECAAVAARFSQAQDYLDVYDRFGLCGDRSVFAHGIHLSGRACARLAQSGAGIAVCPSSNLFLGSGFFDFGQADAFGVRLGLGTDIGAGTSFSMLHTAGLAYQAALAHGVRLDPFRALHLATAGSARLLRIADRTGALEPGQEADFVVLDDAATPLLARRTAGATLAERLFAMQVLGDDRTVRRTYILGECAWDRDAFGLRGMRFALSLLMLLSMATPGWAQETRRKVIIDDEGFGLGHAMLLDASDVEVLGITTVSGNAWANRATALALRGLERMQRTDVPVVQGATYPLLNSEALTDRWEALYGKLTWKGAWMKAWVEPTRQSAPPYHGPREPVNLPGGNPVAKASPEIAANFLIRMVRAHPGQVTIVAMGPLTNLALAQRLDPDFAGLAKELVYMGGSLNPQQVRSDTSAAEFAREFAHSPRREFNARFDPEAASIVSRSPWRKLTVVPVDPSTATQLTPALIARMTAAAPPGVASWLATMEPGFPLWDEIAAGVWLDPAIVTRRETMFIDYDTQFGPGYGDMLSWRAGYQPGVGEQSADVVRTIDPGRLEALIVRLLGRRAAPLGRTGGR